MTLCWLIQDFIPEAIPSHKFHMNLCPIFNIYEDMGIWNVACIEIFTGKPVHQ
jgi:hypothetical protein